MPHLPEKPTLKDFQRYVDALIHERGFDKETLPELFMLFLEECGELARVARKQTTMKAHHGKAIGDVEHEIADVFIYFLDICNKLGVDVEKAFRKKEEVNKRRVWK